MSVLVSPAITGNARDRLIQAAQAGQDLDPARARRVRVIEYEVPDRDGDGKGELIALITTITAMTDVPASALAEAYHQRWEHEIGHRWYRSSCADFSWLCSLAVAGLLVGRVPPGSGVVAGRACPAFA
jgi:hypothetical protein